MFTGAIFPQTEIGSSPAEVSALATGIESMGYEHLLLFDHVLGADTSGRPAWQGPYTASHQFHEVFVTMGYVAAITSRIKLGTAVLILPQRQTALVAKQAAEVDVLSNGRLLLGVGLGWNAVEYDSLGQDFHTRGRRSEEQVALMRELWTQDVVSFSGKWDTLDRVGINPMPVQKPIPVWFGGGESEGAFRRIARIADGWFPPMGMYRPDTEGKKSLDRFRNLVAESGRNPSDVGIGVRARLADGVDEALRQSEAWAALGATHLTVNTMGAGYLSVPQHLDAHQEFLERAREYLDLKLLPND